MMDSSFSCRRETDERRNATDLDRTRVLDDLEIHTGASQLSDQASLMMDMSESPGDDQQINASSDIQAPRLYRISAPMTPKSETNKKLVFGGKVVQHEVWTDDSYHYEPPAFDLPPIIPFSKKKGLSKRWLLEHTVDLVAVGESATSPRPSSLSRFFSSSLTFKEFLYKFFAFLRRAGALRKDFRSKVWRFSTRGLNGGSRSNRDLFKLPDGNSRIGILRNRRCKCLCCNQKVEQTRSSPPQDPPGFHTPAIPSLPEFVLLKIRNLLDINPNLRIESIVATLHHEPALLPFRGLITPMAVFDYCCTIHERKALSKIETERNSLSNSQLAYNLWYNTNLSVGSILLLLRGQPNLADLTEIQLLRLFSDLGITSGQALWQSAIFRMMKRRNSDQDLLRDINRGSGYGMNSETLRQYVYEMGHYGVDQHRFNLFEWFAIQIWRAKMEREPMEKLNAFVQRLNRQRLRLH